MVVYLRRSLKYLVYLIILFFAIYGLMRLTDTTDITANSFSDFLATERGRMMLLACLVLALAYPFIGFTTRTFTSANLSSDQEKLINGFSRYGFSLVEKSADGKSFVFQADNFMKKLTMLFEDKIEVIVGEGETIHVKGQRREIARLIFKLEIL